MELISTKDYLLLIDEEAEISKIGTLIYENDTNLLNITGVDYEPQGLDSKIIAYYPLTKEAKELDLPLLPPFVEEINFSKWYEDQNYPQAYNNSDLFEEEITVESFKWSYMSEAFEAGYKAAQSKQFSLEDIKKAFNAGYDLNIWEQLGIPNEERDYLNEIEYIQSPSTQQLPKEFIPEYEAFRDFDWVKEEINHIDRLKTTTNSKGKEELVGTYKY